LAICDQFPFDLPAPDVLVEVSAEGSRSSEDVLHEAQARVWASL
jgi:hypothetical protein